MLSDIGIDAQNYAEFYLERDCACEQDNQCSVCRLKDLFEEFGRTVREEAIEECARISENFDSSCGDSLGLCGCERRIAEAIRLCGFYYWI